MTTISPYHDKTGAPISIEQFSKLQDDLDYRRIGWREFEGDIQVSTVWLGLDHGGWLEGGPPVIFETMIFGPDPYPYHQAQARYTTEAEAVEGHRRTCDDVEHGRRPWFLEERS